MCMNNKTMTSATQTNVCMGNIKSKETKENKKIKKTN